MSKLVLAVPNFPGKEKLIAATSKVAIKAAKHSPEICIGVGIAAGIGATVMACRATLRINEVIDEHNNTMAKINMAKEAAEAGQPIDGYTVEEAQKEKFILFVQTAVKVGKLYAPAIILGMTSIGFILGGHHIMVARNAAMGVAYAGLQKAYDEYRQRVRETIGEEKEDDIYRGIKEVEIEEKNDKGKVVKKKVFEETGPMSPYARIFDESSCWWRKDSDLNMAFLTRAEHQANDTLRIRGYLFLNEVYDMLGIPKSDAGQLVGWIFGEGDSCVSFGIDDKTKEGVRRFVNGYERNIWLDFNVDGPIYNRIDEIERRKRECRLMMHAV